MRRIRPSSVVPGAAVKPKRARASTAIPVLVAAFRSARRRTLGCQSLRTSRSRASARALGGCLRCPAT